MARVSVITPVFDTDWRMLAEAVTSVREQRLEDWQLVLVDDGSTRPETVAALALIESVDPRIDVVRSVSNGGIVAASNAGLARATGDAIAFLDHDDVLFAGALDACVAMLDAGADAVYTDEARLAEDGTYFDTLRKPDWAPTYLLSCNYINHLSVFTRALLDAAGGLRDGFDGAQDHDLWLRVAEQGPVVAHVAEPLYGWRMARTSVAGSTGGDAKPDALHQGVAAIADAESRRGASGSPRTFAMGLYRSDPPATRAAVHTLVVGDDAHLTRRRAADLQRTLAPGDSVRAMVDGSVPADAEYVALLDAGVIPAPGWLDHAVHLLQVGGADAVGGRLVASDGAPVLDQLARTASGDLVDVVLAGLPGHVMVPREVSAVWGGFVVTRRAVFDRITLGAPVVAGHDGVRRVVATPWAEGRWTGGPITTAGGRASVTLADPYCPWGPMLHPSRGLPSLERRVPQEQAAAVPAGS